MENYFLKLPNDIIRKKSVVNINNTDGKYFAHAVKSALRNSTGSSNRLSLYPPYEIVFNFEGIDFPVELKDIYKFEKLKNISVNVFGTENYTKINCVNEIV